MIIGIQLFVSICMVFLLFFGLYNLFRKGEYISYKTIFLILSIFDVYIPALVGVMTGKYKTSPFYQIKDESTYCLAILAYTMFVALIIIGYKCVKKKNKEQFSRQIHINESFLFLLFVFVVMMVALNLIIEYKACGSWTEFYNYKVTRAYLKTIDYNSALEKIIQGTSGFRTTLLFIVLSIGLSNYKVLKHKFFWKIISPAVSFVVVLTTLYRGTILGFFVVLVLAYQSQLSSNSSLERTRISKRKIVFGLAIGVIGFFIYGAVRNHLALIRWGEEKITFGESIVTSFVDTFGTSLVALSRCVQYLKDGKSVLYGQTIYEMFYAFVPRAILPDKPVQYGIITIDILMGSTATSMSAVTAMGELLCNFHVLGFIFVLPIGMIFSMLSNMRFNYRLKYLYFATLTTLVTTTMWMGFTGFFSTFKYFLIYYVVIVALIKKERVSFEYAKDKCNNERLQRNGNRTQTID